MEEHERSSASNPNMNLENREKINSSSAPRYRTRSSRQTSTAPKSRTSASPVDEFNVEYVRSLTSSLLSNTYDNACPTSIQTLVSADKFLSMIKRVKPLLRHDGVIAKVRPRSKDCRVCVVGDTHGQFHDLVHLISLGGEPHDSTYWVFNGDYIDRGAWGVEVLLVLFAWKLCWKDRVFLLRGNHETDFCTTVYGFRSEIERKYGYKSDTLYMALLKLFTCLPVAAVVNDKTLILHGGLFRCPNKRGRNSKDIEKDLACGSLKDLARAGRGSVDPFGDGMDALPSDVLWSDPMSDSGIKINIERGVGLCFGPDVTQSFLREHDLKLIIRSHEGPDARQNRIDCGELLGSLLNGFSVDHSGPNGKLVTLFSAPDYPQFLGSNETRVSNKGAIIILKGPDYFSPDVVTYSAAPRPKADAYYDVDDVVGSDDDAVFDQDVN